MPASEPPLTWPDGTRRSSNNGFTHGFLDRPHGYVIGGPIKERKPGRNPRAEKSFGTTGGTILDLNPRKNSTVMYQRKRA